MLANERKHNRCVNAQNHVFFGGWNVRSCIKQSKREIIIKQLKKYKIHIAALSETCMCDSGVKLVSDYTMIYSGAPYDKKTRKTHGVAICLNPIATKVWKDSGSEWVPINERIIKIRLYCAPIHITVIAVYSPINPKTKLMSDESDKFYNDLQDTLKDISPKDMIIITHVKDVRPEMVRSYDISRVFRRSSRNTREIPRKMEAVFPPEINGNFHITSRPYSVKNVVESCRKNPRNSD